MAWALDWGASDDWFVSDSGSGDGGSDAGFLFAGAGEPGIRMLGNATKIAIGKGMSPRELAGAFRGTGFVPSPHFIDRLRGVASPGKRADPERMEKLGIHSMQDVLNALRHGERKIDANEHSYIDYAGSGGSDFNFRIWINPDGKTLGTIMPVNRVIPKDKSR